MKETIYNLKNRPSNRQPGLILTTIASIFAICILTSNIDACDVPLQFHNRIKGKPHINPLKAIIRCLNECTRGKKGQYTRSRKPTESLDQKEEAHSENAEGGKSQKLTSNDHDGEDDDNQDERNRRSDDKIHDDDSDSDDSAEESEEDSDEGFSSTKLLKRVNLSGKKPHASSGKRPRTIKASPDMSPIHFSDSSSDDGISLYSGSVDLSTAAQKILKQQGVTNKLLIELTEEHMREMHLSMGDRLRILQFQRVSVLNQTRLHRHHVHPASHRTLWIQALG